MTFPHEIFKAYDIRGVVETALTPQMVEQIGRAFGSEALEQGIDTVVVGRDGRLTGPRLSEALCLGLTSTGCNVIDIGQVPTPTLYFTTVELNTGTGIQVTGSHNPPEYNGLKMMINGKTLSGQSILDLKNRILESNLVTSDSPGTVREQSMLPTYLDRITRDIHLKRPMKVVIDCGNGVAGGIAPQVFESIGCEVDGLFCEVDGNFPNHHPDPSQLENLQDLIQRVKSTGADFGMAFDGDGDRLGVVSANGDVIWPDRQMVLFAQSILKSDPGAEIIYDVKCSQQLPKAIENAGGKPMMWKTGHSFIKGKLKETGAALAGEMSGHIFFNDRWGGFDDGIYAGARMCELLSDLDQPPAEVFAALPNTVNTPELRLDMAEGEHYGLVEQLAKAADFPDAVVTTIDGIRVDFSDGFGLIRASNTTPSLIMRFEASDEEGLHRIQSMFRALLLQIRADLVLPF